MEIAREEVFGPVLNLMRFDDLEAAIELANKTPFGNGACIYTQSRQCCPRIQAPYQSRHGRYQCGCACAAAYFPFSGWDYSFFGDLHLQGRESVLFYTRHKVTTSRWFRHGEGDIWHKD